MHYHAEVWLKYKPENIKNKIDEIMSSHVEFFHEDEEKYTGFWDWYQIGGRWKGAHIPDYDANKDPENFNHKDGGIAWPTQWPAHPLDIIELKKVAEDFSAFTLIVGESAYEDLTVPVKEKLKELGIDNEGYLVTVDYHR